MNTEKTSALHKLRAGIRTFICLRPDARSVAHFFAALLLSGTDLGIGPTPAGACLLGACGAPSLTASALGAVAGYLLFWGHRAALVPCSIVVAMLCARLALPKQRQRVLIPAIGIGASLIATLPFVIADRFSGISVLRWLINGAVAAGGILLFRAALTQKSYPARVASVCALLPGLSAIRGVGKWNAAALAWAVCAPDGLTYACAGSAVLALVAPGTAPYCAAFGLSALLHRLLCAKPAELKTAAACCIYCLASLRFQGYGFAICAMVGTFAALLIRPERVLPALPAIKLPHHPAQQELRNASEALSQAAQMLDMPDPAREVALIFDAASAAVCRSCAKYETCWQENAQQVYEDLSQIAPAILARGVAQPEDLRFRDQCIHPEAFVTAINDALDENRAAQRFRSRLAETRIAAKTQYAAISRLLSHLAERIYAPGTEVHFEPELSVQAAGRSGNAISGDRGAAFLGPDATYYVLLCDGMGTGAGAAEESTQAVSLLRRMLLCGLDAESALRALNGIYVLRDNGCFSTVDLLRINLTSGDAILYKWGAAPSYLKRSRGLRHLGGASLPPGLSNHESFSQIRLSMDHGGVLVLLSDGLSGKESQRRLECCDSMLPQDVALSLFAGREPGPDDCTAVAIRLKRASRRDPVPT